MIKALELKRLNYSHEEIAIELGKKLHAVNKLIYRAHRKIKQKELLQTILAG